MKKKSWVTYVINLSNSAINNNDLKDNVLYSTKSDDGGFRQGAIIGILTLNLIHWIQCAIYDSKYNW